ncbi:hypothetical protein LXA43DRAFT_1054571 [Ganoderma leucocontextum]|nr:hypothetical protein LXA43DRAFT_1054571 [Ganoderma leucocontextum]
MNHPRFLHFLHDPRTRAASRRREFYHIPDEGDDVTYTNSLREAILALINSVFHNGHHALFSQLAVLLAPGCGPAYVTQPSPQGFQPRVLFIWRPLPLRAQRRLHAQYSVFFYIDTAPPLSVAHLTFTLLHFTYLAVGAYISSNYNFDPHRLPRMTHLAYDLSAARVYGIAYFDNLGVAFAEASTNGLWLNFGYRRPAAVVTTWPPNAGQLLLWAHHHNYGLIAHCNQLSRLLTSV